MKQSEPPKAGSAKRKRLTISLGGLLALSFGGLVALSVGAVLTLSVMTNFVNTFSLLNDRAIVLFDSMERRIRSEAQQAERAVSAVARLYAQGRIDAAQSPERRTALETVLLGLPSVEGIIIYDGDTFADGLFRRPEGSIDQLPAPIRQARLSELFATQSTRSATGPVWHRPVVIGETMFHAVSQRLGRNGENRGTVVALIGRDSISRIMVRLGTENNATVFLLGNDNSVIAHSGLPHVFRNRIAIPLDEFPDKTLQRIAEARPERDNFQAANRQGIEVLVTEGRDDGYMFLTKSLMGSSASPFKLGIYYPKADVGEEILRAIVAMIAGLIGLLMAVIAAVLLGRYLSRPMRQIARTAAQLSDFAIDDISPLPHSRVREVDDQANALNRMNDTLHQFTRYVPRELVARLMRSGTDAGRPVQRDMTVMFTDIVGFTTLSERMDAAEVTALLNAHFAMITGHVEATGGTIDKFLGDGVMAFWGAPEADAEHVLHAVQSARAIALSMREDNAARRNRGQQPLQLRIGIHTGRVVVGDIGGEDRKNYTIVGDAVNVAQRLEQMSRDVMTVGDDAIVLVSTDVTHAVEGQASFTPAGTRVVRGREKPIAVSVLNVDGTDKAGNVVPFTDAG